MYEVQIINVFYHPVWKIWVNTCSHKLCDQGAGKCPGSEKKKKKKSIAQNSKDLATAYICFWRLRAKDEFKAKINILEGCSFIYNILEGCKNFKEI